MSQQDGQNQGNWQDQGNGNGQNNNYGQFPNNSFNPQFQPPGNFGQGGPGGYSGNVGNAPNFGGQGIPNLSGGMQGNVPGGMQTGFQGGFPGGMQGAIQTGMQGGMPTGMQGSMPTGMQGGMPTGIQGGMPTGMQGGMPTGMQGGMPTGIQGGMPTGMQGGMPTGIQGGMPTGMQGGMPTGIQGGMPTGMQGGMPTGMQGGMPTGIQGVIPGGWQGMPPMQVQGGMSGGFPGMQSTSYQMSPIPFGNSAGMPVQGMVTMSKQQEKGRNKEIEDLNEKIQDLEQQLEKEKNNKRKALQDLNNTNTSLEQEKVDLEGQVNLLNTDLKKLKRTLNDKNDREQELMSQLKQLQDEYDELQQKQQTLINAAMRNTGSQNKQGPDPMINLSIFQEGQQNQTNKLKNEIKKLEDEASKYKKEIQELIDEKQKMQEELDKEHRNFLSATDEVVNKNKQITQLNKKIKDLEDSLENQLRALRQKNNDLKESQLALEDLKYLNQQQQNQIEQLQKTEQKLREFLNSKNKVSESQLANELKKFQEQSDNILRQKQLDLEQQRAKTDQEKEKLRKKMEDEKIAFENKQKMLAQQEGQQNKNRLQQAQKNLDEAKKEQGQLDVCFLVDVTGSMESYKEQTKQSVMGALQIIKKSVNRETNWAAICYQDIAEKKQLKGKYHEFPFSKDSAQLQKWFDTVNCSGGGDGAEDVKGAIEQMNNLKWPSKFRIAILICDAPCHGHKYHKGITSDDYPQDEIKPAIEKMIELGITFIGLNFTKYTKTMYEEFKKIFADKKKEDVFLYQDLQNLSKGDMSAQMVKYLGEASQNATHTNKRQTKSKNENQNVVVRNKDGAMEALCKAGNFYNFENDEKIKCCDTKFKVLKVEIKQDAFDKNIQTIEKITVPRDYQVTEEGTWDCIRTEKPFAFGMMKDVFLMKKKQGGNMELYVIKTPIGSKPYTSLNDALTECRSHLICQKLMKKFREQLIQKAEDKGVQRKFPPIIYSDFLILQESMNSFWIAERFFNGEFVKYNNNFGFIESDINDLNKMAQAFSFYTYFISDFNYMVSDVQGVGNYFTDPAINTKDGKFDDTDMGLEGQQMYLVSYELKKDILSKELLEILDMYE